MMNKVMMAGAAALCVAAGAGAAVTLGGMRPAEAQVQAPVQPAVQFAEAAPSGGGKKKECNSICQTLEKVHRMGELERQAAAADAQGARQALGQSMVSQAVAAASLPEPGRKADGLGAVSGKAIMPDGVSSKGVVAIACAAPFDGCRTKYMAAEPKFAIGKVASLVVPVVGDRFHFIAWKDENGDGVFSAGDYFAVAEDGDSVSSIADVGSMHMRMAEPSDL
ncbi:MAG TPA: hypothetical protein VI381_05830 [Allosphingosinicella sp.]